ncbi:MAG: maltotransferase domain-containing protein [Polyangia bacterium]
MHATAAPSPKPTLPKKGPALIERVTPTVEGGRHAAKRIVGDTLTVEADIFRDGHASLRALLRLTDPAGTIREVPMRPMLEHGIPLSAATQDRWRAQIALDVVGMHHFEIEAYTDHYGSWLRDLGKKVAAKRDVKSDRLEGHELVTRTAEALSQAGRRDEAAELRRYATLMQLAPDDAAAVTIASEAALVELMARVGDRPDIERSAAFPLYVDRELAAFSAWYELFPRSQGEKKGEHGTFRSAAKRLPEIADLGFDIVYLPPIHPIGKVNRKGRNNSLTSEPGEPGSPWAIGSVEGGHDAIDPRLGTIADFDAFVATARRLKLEIALDFAIQCAPDHPWVTQHPDWFFRRPDGSIKYAENPPKEYQDVYSVNFDTPDVEALIVALGDVLRFWLEHGVTVFRVDNPHTKPLYVWERLIAELQAQDPNVLFLAEAFTRPKMMRALGKVGFSQSYTYFTWRTTKYEIVEYMTELVGEMNDFYRPNFWVNTPDILPKMLQTSSPAAFKQRFVLAATLSPSYGVYSGYELNEGAALPDSEEYLHSEKYELKFRDYDAPGNLKAFIARINTIRRENPALHRLVPIEFVWTESEHILAYARSNADKSNVILVVVNLDPIAEHHGRCYVAPEVVGVQPGERYTVNDLLSGQHYEWGQDNYVALDPNDEPAHIFRIERR